ncbi:THUMP domain-containing class I SAM-dependent RNA methyltransferase [Cytophaga aurantiaca]|uniref:THUMP domain-containing class I SAM-dependent RNA methyltransferase n=1 Tax=Cytophaga aurantiaca TaxID=29530 RepID=UPI00039BF5D3|nr:THUMP domain-containing protein [Cytophaga aurantiaca]
MKTSIFEQSSDILITCAPDLSPLTAREIAQLSIPIKKILIHGIVVEGTAQTAMYLCMHLRTANKVLFLLKEAQADTPEDLYRVTKKINWDNYFSNTSYFSIDSFVQNSTIRDTRFANVKCKDAIADYFVEKTGTRPDSGPLRDKVVIFLYWKESSLSIYLDLSGEPISRHGYRVNPWKAPMAEPLAAGVVITSEWNPETPFINPMCGSGTLAIEAALIGINKIPGLIRNEYAFQHIHGYDEATWHTMKKMAMHQVKSSLPFKIIASDHDQRALDAAKGNAEIAGVDHLIDFVLSDFQDTPIEADQEGVVILNPEYGERLGDEESLVLTYKEIGDFFKQKCGGYKGFVFTGNLELAKRIGLKPKRKIKFFSAKIECRLMQYELYSGTKRVVFKTE